jgi:hypothetical protein
VIDWCSIDQTTAWDIAVRQTLALCDQALARWNAGKAQVLESG